MADVPLQVLDAETDARFWAQTGYKPGQKLDPHDPTDKAMEPVWSDIFAKVKREAAAGKLVTTYDHPAVAQHLADAHAHDQETIAHLDAAATSPDLATAQQHVAAAATSAALSAQKTSTAASQQPPTSSPQLTKEAAQTAASQPRHPHEHGHHHLAQAQATSAHKPSPQNVLDKETDARFWAQTGYRPGQKLDPHDPTDAKMIPVWKDVYAKVKGEDAAGSLVLTYNNPVVSQHLADAYVADKAAHMHADAAAAAPPHEVPQHVEAAATAAQVSRHKTAEAAKVQPPTVSPGKAHAAGGAVAHDQTTTAPPTNARDAIGQAQAMAAGHHAEGVHRHHQGHGRPVHASTLSPRRLHEYRTQAAHFAHEGGGQYVLVIQHDDGKLDRRVFHSRTELDAAYAQLAEHHDHYRYVGAFDLGANAAAPIHDSVGVPAAEHVEAPPPSGAEGSAEGPPAGDAGATAASDAAPPETPRPKSKWSTGAIAAIAVGIAATGGLLYVASHSKPKAHRGRSRSPKVLVTGAPTPTRALRM